MRFERYQQYVHRAIALLGGVVVVSAFLYGTFLLEAVLHTAARSHAQKQVAELSSKISGLEARYLAATKSLTKERALSLGYVDPPEITTVFASALSPTLSLSSESHKTSQVQTQ